MQWSSLMGTVNHYFLTTTKELIPGPRDYFLQLVVFAKCLKACRYICRKIEHQLLSRGLWVNGKTGDLEMLVDVTYCILNRMTSAVQSSLEVVISIRIIPECLFLIPVNFLIFLLVCLSLAFSKIEIIFKYFSRERPLQKSILIEELIGFKVFSLYPQIPVLNTPGLFAC